MAEEQVSPKVPSQDSHPTEYASYEETSVVELQGYGYSCAPRYRHDLRLRQAQVGVRIDRDTRNGKTMPKTRLASIWKVRGFGPRMCSRSSSCTTHRLHADKADPRTTRDSAGEVRDPTDVIGRQLCTAAEG